MARSIEGRIALCEVLEGSAKPTGCLIYSALCLVPGIVFLLGTKH